MVSQLQYKKTKITKCFVLWRQYKYLKGKIFVHHNNSISIQTGKRTSIRDYGPKLKRYLSNLKWLKLPVSINKESTLP